MPGLGGDRPGSRIHPGKREVHEVSSSVRTNRAITHSPGRDRDHRTVIHLIRDSGQVEILKRGTLTVCPYSHLSESRGVWIARVVGDRGKGWRRVNGGQLCRVECRTHAGTPIRPVVYLGAELIGGIRGEPAHVQTDESWV